MANIWDDEEKVSEYELIEEVAQQTEQLAEEYSHNPNTTEADEDSLQEIAQKSAFDLNRSESNVVYNARLRLEQAKLYEMLINHNLFEGVDASPEAISNVQNELKFYIVKRLEILLGIREPVVEKTQTAMSESQLNEIEVDFLRQLAYKGTLGASASNTVSAKNEPRAVRVMAATTQAPKLKAFSQSREKTEVISKQKKEPRLETQKVSRPETQKIPKKQVERPTLKIRETGLGREMSSQEAEQIAKADLLKNPPTKSFKDMTAKEKAGHIREVNERHKRPVATAGVIAMPSPNELEMKYMNQQTNKSMSRNQTDQFNVMLANALAVQKNKGEYND